MAGSPALAPFAGYRPGSSGYRRVSVALFAGGLATFAELYATQAVLTELSHEFDLSPSASALSLSTATLGIGIGLIVIGPLTENLGRTLLMRTSLVASGVIGICCAFAPNWPMSLGLRFLQGAALAGFAAVAVAYLREELDAAHTARATGLYVGRDRDRAG